MGAPGATPGSRRSRCACATPLAWRRSLDLGAWEMPTRGLGDAGSTSRASTRGDSLIYFVDRYRDFSIYDVDFGRCPA